MIYFGVVVAVLVLVAAGAAMAASVDLMSRERDISLEDKDGDWHRHYLCRSCGFASKWCSQIDLCNKCGEKNPRWWDEPNTVIRRWDRKTKSWETK